MNITASGTRTNPIYIKCKPGSHVIIDSLGDFALSGNDVVIDGSDGLLEIMTDSWSGDRFLTTDQIDFDIFGARSKVVNCIIHDFGSVGNWSPAIDGFFEENLVYNIGRGNGSQGHLFYTQNNIGTKTVKKNIFSQTFESLFTVHQYGSGASTLKGYLYEDNISVGASWLMGSASSKVEETTLRRNISLKGNVTIGLLGSTDPEHEFNMQDQVIVDGALVVKKGSNYIVNQLTSYKGSGSYSIELNNSLNADVDNNAYNFYGTVPFNKLYSDTVGYPSIAAWRAAKGYDTNSQLTEYSGSIPPDFVQVIPFTRDTRRAGVFIANWSEASTVDINLSSVTGLVNGETYRLLNCQNPNEYHEFTYDGSPVSVPMTGWTVAIPIGTEGGAMTPVESIFPTYGIFYLMKAI